MVFSAVPSSSAICRLGSPDATRAKTSRSPGCEGPDSGLDGAGFLPLMPLPGVPFQGTRHRVQEILGLEGFGEEVHGPGLHGPDARGDVPHSGDENDGEGTLRNGQRLLEIQAAEAGQVDIQDEAPGTVLRGAARNSSADEKDCTRYPAAPSRRDNAVRTEGSSSTTKRNGDPGLHGSAPAAAAPGGRWLRPRGCSRPTRPPWARVMVRQMASPIPIPSALLVTKGSKTCSSRSSGIPGPESRNAATTSPDSFARVRTPRCPPAVTWSRHGFQSVDHEVQDDLLDLYPVSPDLREPLHKLQCHRDIFQESVALH